jgi:hypothetical protein
MPFNVLKSYSQDTTKYETVSTTVPHKFTGAFREVRVESRTKQGAIWISERSISRPSLIKCHAVLEFRHPWLEERHQPGVVRKEKLG